MTHEAAERSLQVEVLSIVSEKRFENLICRFGAKGSASDHIDDLPSELFRISKESSLSYHCLFFSAPSLLCLPFAQAWLGCPSCPGTLGKLDLLCTAPFNLALASENVKTTVQRATF